MQEFFYFFLQTDKFRHLIISLLLLFVFVSIRIIFLKRKGFLRQLSFSLRDILIIGIFKEIIDLFGFGNPELLDLFANSFGIIIVFYAYYIYREGTKLDQSKSIRYEIKLLQKLEQKTILLFNRIFFYIKIKFKLIFYKRKILYYISERSKRFLLKKTLIDFSHIIKITLIFSIVWVSNLIILIIKIPFVAFYDTINTIIWMIKYSIGKNKKDLDFVN